MKFRSSFPLIAVVLGAMIANSAVAEEKKKPVSRAYVSLYAGTSISDEEGFFLDRPAAGEKSFRLNSYKGRTGSVRFGRWQKNSAWFGVATDFTYQITRTSEVELDIMTVAPMLMARIPIGSSEENPDGLVTLYAGFGPTLNRIRITADMRPDLSQVINDIELTMGYQWAAGARWQVIDGVFLVGEYRYMADDFWISEYEGSACAICPDVLSGDARVNAHHILFGVSFPL